MKAIGIDLGTTFSRVGVWHNEKFEIVTNEHGNQSTPNYIAFNKDGRLIGEDAKNQVTKNPTNTVFDTKRIIGRSFADSNIRNDIQNFPFKVVDNRGKPNIQIEYKGQMHSFIPEEISAMLLTKMKELAESHSGTKIEDAVISVPAYFNDAQRQATIDAGKIAGLRVLRIINEPTAAALAYGLEKKLRGEKNILVFDLGGGTLDVSIVIIEDGELFQVKATSGNTCLGGLDFDAKIVGHLAKEFSSKYKRELTKNPRALRRLWTAAEKAKRTLSSSFEANIEIDSILEDVDFYTKLSRSRFEEICSELFLQILEPVQNVFIDAKMAANEIHDVVLVGGATRMPKVAELLRKHFTNTPASFISYSEEAVVTGATIQAAIVSDRASLKLKDVLILDITPLSLGFQTTEGAMQNVIENNSQLPIKQFKFFSTLKENQQCIPIPMYEWDRNLMKTHRYLGEFLIVGIPPGKPDEHRIIVYFDIDLNGILDVTAKYSEKGPFMMVVNNKGRPSRMDIERLRAKLGEFRKDDETKREKVFARNKLEAYVTDVEDMIDGNGNKLSDSDRVEVRRECKEVMVWLDENLMAEKDDYESRLRSLIKFCQQFHI